MAGSVPFLIAVLALHVLVYRKLGSEAQAALHAKLRIRAPGRCTYWSTACEPPPDILYCLGDLLAKLHDGSQSSVPLFGQ